MNVLCTSLLFVCLYKIGLRLELDVWGPHKKMINVMKILRTYLVWRLFGGLCLFWLRGKCSWQNIHNVLERWWFGVAQRHAKGPTQTYSIHTEHRTVPLILSKDIQTKHKSNNMTKQTMSMKHIRGCSCEDEIWLVQETEPLLISIQLHQPAPLVVKALGKLDWHDNTQRL